MEIIVDVKKSKVDFFIELMKNMRCVKDVKISTKSPKTKAAIKKEKLK